MKASPVQLLRLTFKHINVALDPVHVPPTVPNPLESVFLFDGVGIHTEVSIGASDSQDNGRLYFLTLQVVVDNMTQPDMVKQKYSPYTIDIATEGVVLVPKESERLGQPEDLAIVNGTSLLWSAVREQVLSLTARMRAGPVMLPTVHFHDVKERSVLQPAAQPPATSATSAATRPAKRRAR
jgi:hypothetical protein